MITTSPVLSDEAVPGAAAITDEVALAARLEQVGERLLRVGYLRYKPGTSLVAALGLASGPAFAYAVAPGSRPKLAKTIQQAPAGSVLIDEPGTALLIARPAADRDLPALAGLERFLARMGLAPEAIRSRTDLAYKPQRRWVGRLDLADDRRLIARAYRPADLTAALTAWQIAALADGPVLVPSVRATNRRRGLVVTSWLHGTPLDRLLADGPVSAGTLHEVGVGLARLHSAASRPAGSVSALDERLAPVEAVANQLAQVLPEVHDRVRALVDRLAAVGPTVDLEHPVHGDFSTDQVIVDAAGRIGITDWDRAGWADPAADLGSLRAAGLDPAAYDEVLSGYAGVREVPTTVGWYLARARLLRLPEPLRQGRPDWRAQVAARLTELEQLP